MNTLPNREEQDYKNFKQTPSPSKIRGVYLATKHTMSFQAKVKTKMNYSPQSRSSNNTPKKTKANKL